jgi:hypothetical protein
MTSCWKAGHPDDRWFGPLLSSTLISSKHPPGRSFSAIGYSENEPPHPELSITRSVIELQSRRGESQEETVTHASHAESGLTPSGQSIASRASPFATFRSASSRSSRLSDTRAHGTQQVVSIRERLFDTVSGLGTPMKVSTTDQIEDYREQFDAPRPDEASLVETSRGRGNRRRVGSALRAGTARTQSSPPRRRAA